MWLVLMENPRIDWVKKQLCLSHLTECFQTQLPNILGIIYNSHLRWWLMVNEEGLAWSLIHMGWEKNELKYGKFMCGNMSRISLNNLIKAAYGMMVSSVIWTVFVFSDTVYVFVTEELCSTWVKMRYILFSSKTLYSLLLVPFLENN